MADQKLYHYTSRGGLLGMVNSKSLWLTHMMYMNDAVEYQYGLDMVIKILKEQYDNNLASQLIDAVERNKEIPSIFSFSLSENKDTLSQWRGYCPNGGYSISFDEALLKESIAANANTTLRKCVYTVEEIVAIVKEDIVRMTPEAYFEQRELEKTRGTSKPLSGLPYELISRAYQHIPYIKNPAFHEEKEWRIVVAEHHEKPFRYTDNVQFREGKSSLIPFVVMDLKDKTINEAIISPTLDEELAIQACKKLIGINEVSASEIPYRNW
ncbi:DUF2971 domain-containing protein [Pedobacter cryotolerans]|uniref:DUF2971 domain-containing protein n=1 Tax=Pedobacter cryotolerans TaxID=2571270 RepID=A0A4U1BVG2_9SPHI|nr:DUF2971 domain-containing protein [Pedobacter cryotolerans]TKB96181.1 DUF2971 domain-containing protein [Pedobacter cryotolerans]